MRRQQIQPKLFHLVLLISLAVLLVLLALPATMGAAPEAQVIVTPTPQVVVATATPTSNPTPAAPAPDAAEPNDTIADARPIELGGTIDNLTLYPTNDVDNFVFFVKPDMVGMSAIIDTYITYGMDTRLRVLRPDGSTLAENDDASAGDKRSHLSVALTESGYFIIEVTNASIVPPDAKTYSLETRLVTRGEAAAQPTPGPEGGKPDAYENNYDFDHAPEIAVGQQLDGLNFLCPPGAAASCGDNDFFAVSLKGGVCYVVQTLKLSPGIDTNLIVYGPQRDAAPPWAGNDDAAPGVLESHTRFCVPRTLGSIIGYLLVGNAGNRIPPAPAAQRTYSLRVDVEISPTPTAVPMASGANAPAAGPLASGAVAASDAPKGTAIVSATATALRDTPDPQGRTIQTLPRETLVLLQGQASGAWVRVQVANGVLPGWVYGPDLKRIDEAAPTAAALPTRTSSGAPEVGAPGTTASPGSSSGIQVITTPTLNALPPPHVVALQATPMAVPLPAQRISLAVSVLLVGSGSTAPTAPPAVGAGTPTPRAGGLPPLAGIRVQLVNAFGDVLAEAITPDSGEVTLRRDLALGMAVFIRVPGPGLHIPVDTKQPASALTITLPVGG